MSSLDEIERGVLSGRYTVANVEHLPLSKDRYARRLYRISDTFFHDMGMVSPGWEIRRPEYDVPYDTPDAARERMLEAVAEVGHQTWGRAADVDRFEKIQSRLGSSHYATRDLCAHRVVLDTRLFTDDLKDALAEDGAQFPAILAPTIVQWHVNPDLDVPDSGHARRSLKNAIIEARGWRGITWGYKPHNARNGSDPYHYDHLDDPQDPDPRGYFTSSHGLDEIDDPEDFTPSQDIETPEEPTMNITSNRAVQGFTDTIFGGAKLGAGLTTASQLNKALVGCVTRAAKRMGCPDFVVDSKATQKIARLLVPGLLGAFAHKLPQPDGMDLRGIVRKGAKLASGWEFAKFFEPLIDELRDNFSTIETLATRVVDEAKSQGYEDRDHVDIIDP